MYVNEQTPARKCTLNASSIYPSVFQCYDDDYDENLKLAGLHNSAFLIQYAKQDVILAKHITQPVML